MAMQQWLRVQHSDVFPKGAFLKSGPDGPVTPVADFKANLRADGSRPQQLDKETGLPLWQVTVLDADEDAGKKDTALTVKFAAKVRPVPPENTTPFPWTPVEFVGLVAMPYVDDSAQRVENGQIVGRPRVTWTFRANDLVAPGQAGKSKAAA